MSSRGQLAPLLSQIEPGAAGGGVAGGGGVVVGNVGAEILFFGERNQVGCLVVWLGTEGTLLGDFETLVP